MDADEQEKSVLVSTPDGVALVFTVVLVFVLMVICRYRASDLSTEHP